LLNAMWTGRQLQIEPQIQVLVRLQIHLQDPQ